MSLEIKLKEGLILGGLTMPILLAEIGVNLCFRKKACFAFKYVKFTMTDKNDAGDVFSGLIIGLLSY